MKKQDHKGSTAWMNDHGIMKRFMSGELSSNKAEELYNQKHENMKKVKEDKNKKEKVIAKAEPKKDKRNYIKFSPEELEVLEKYKKENPSSEPYGNTINRIVIDIVKKYDLFLEQKKKLELELEQSQEREIKIKTILTIYKAFQKEVAKIKD